MSAEKKSTLSLFLNEILELRKQRNSRYSLRAFARDLGVSPGKLSEFLSGQRIPGKTLCVRMVAALKMTKDESAKFMHIIERNRAFASENGRARVLREDEFSLVADWEHFALLMLMGTEGFVPKIDWMAQRLQITKSQVQNALERLERLKLIKKTKVGFKRLNPRITTTHDIPSAVVRESHRQVIEHALASLHKDDISVRDITSVTFPTDPQKIEMAKTHIRTFRRKMARLLKGESKTEVYNLNIQLVPVTKANL